MSGRVISDDEHLLYGSTTLPSTMSPTTQSQLIDNDDDDDNYYNPQDGSSPTNNNLFHNLSSDENDDKKSRIKLRYIIPMLTRILTAILAISLIGVVFCVLPYFAVEAGKKGHINQTLYWIAGCFVLITVPISVLGIVQHLVNWYMPQVQKFVVRILFMVPIFSIQSWFSLFFLSAAPYLTAVRELYEAFVLSSFVYYIIELCGGEDQLANKLRMKDPKFGQHTTCLVRSQCGIWQMGRPFLLNCKYGVLQFVFFKIVGTIVVIVLHSQDSFHQGEWGWNSSYTYLAIIMNVSIAYALYCLVTLYFATKDDLKEWNPVWKFICIKGIIFATFWQHFLIQVLYSVGVIKGFGDWDASMAADGLPAFLICIEMLGFAVAHLYAFPHTDYLHYLQRHDQSFNNTTSLLRSPFRGRRMGRGNDNNTETLFLFDQDNNVVNDSSIDTEYQPPTFRQLDRPMSVSRALVSTVNPSETLSDISRMAGSVVVGGEGTSAGRGGNGDRGGGSRRGNSPLTDGEVIFSLDQAEGI